MNDLEFVRQVAQAGYRGYVRGTYLESEDVISDDCLGTWMYDDYNRRVNEAKEAMKDPMAVPVEDYMGWAADAALVHIPIRQGLLGAPHTRRRNREAAAPRPPSRAPGGPFRLRRRGRRPPSP